MPQWGRTAPSSFGAKGSPETNFSLSSSSSNGRQEMASDSGSGIAGEGLQVAVTRGSLRNDSAVSGRSQSTSSMPALEDRREVREGSRRREPIEDIPDCSYGAQRSRARERSPRGIADQDFHRRMARTVRSRDVSESRAILDGQPFSLVSFGEDTLDADLASAMDEDLDSVGPGAPISADLQSVPSGPALSLGPQIAANFAAQSNYDYSVTNQAVVSSDNRSVTINNGITTQEADSLVTHAVHQTQALANVAYEALTVDAKAVIADLRRELAEANQRMESVRAAAEAQARTFSDKEAELLTESKRMLTHAEVEMRKAFDQAQTTKVAGERRFDALAVESERRNKELAQEVQAYKVRLENMEKTFLEDKENTRLWCERQILEEKRRAQYDAENACSTLEGEVKKVKEEARRIQADLDECRVGELSSAKRLHADVSQRTVEMARRRKP